jgi:predicted Na+-dependent transporter/ABC-type nitrate/sulfonate/bicarbonate transport system substrate-binding protein
MALLNFFSLPILTGIVLGTLFPYQALSLIWISSILLFLLLFLNTLPVEPRQVWRSASLNPGFIAATLVFVFGFFPLLIAAASRLFLKDHDFAFGMVLSALAPSALVNPFFARLRGGDGPLSLVMVLTTTLACPFLTVPVLHALGYHSIYFDPNYTIFFLVLLTVAPVALSFSLAPIVKQKMATSWLPLCNSLILAVLIFILVGSSLSRVPFRLLAQGDLPVLTAFFIVADFGFYFAARTAAALFISPRRAETFALAVSSRNFAVSASLMLFFYPKAALPAAIGLIVHAFFFQFLTFKKPGILLALPIAFWATKPLTAQARTPYFHSVTVCVPALGETLGTSAVLAAADLGFFARKDLQVQLKVSAPSAECNAGLAEVTTIENLPESRLAKIEPAFYLIPGEHGAPRLIVKAGQAKRLRQLAGKKIRISKPESAMSIKRLFSKWKLSAPELIVEPDPSLAARDLRTGNLDAAIFFDPVAGALLATGNYVSIPLGISGMDERNDLRSPTAVFYVNKDAVSLKTVAAFGEAFSYVDANPAQSFEFERRHHELLNWKAELNPIFRPAYAGKYFSWPQNRPAQGEKALRELDMINATSPRAAQWMSRRNL